MKELKLKPLWAIDINGIQWTTFKYKKDAIEYAKNKTKEKVFDSFIIVKRKCITDKY